MATIRLRCPDGGSLVRRFLGDDKVEVDHMIQCIIMIVYYVFHFSSSSFTLDLKATVKLSINSYHLFPGEMSVWLYFST